MEIKAKKDNCNYRSLKRVCIFTSLMLGVRNISSFNTKHTIISLKSSSFISKRSHKYNRKTYNRISKNNINYAANTKLWSSGIRNAQEEEQYQSYFNKEYEEKAGISGYSIQRQPLSWDLENDPYFKPPEDIDESSNNKIQMSSLLTDRYINQNKRNTNIRDTVMNKEKEANPSKKGVVSPKDAMVDLDSRTYESLDYEIVLKTLQKQCYTKPAYDFIQYEMDSFLPLTSKNKRKRNRLSSKTYNHVMKQYVALQEMVLSCDDDNNKKPHPIRTFQQTNLDISNIESKIKKRNVLNSNEILDVLNIFTIHQEWHDWFHHNTDQQYIEIPKLLNTIQVNDTFIQFLSNAFEKAPKKQSHSSFLKLSGTTFPKIGYLRDKIKTIKNDILEKLNQLLSNPTLRSKLALENGSTSIYAEMNGRIVIPLDIKYKNIGIVHDISRSGKTAYVEPSELILPTNTLRQLESELETEENKVWKLITIEISSHWKNIQDIVYMLGQLDVLHSKMLLGNMLHGCIPIVKEHGVIDVKDVIHPILQLRHSNFGGDDNEEVLVKNDIQLGVDTNQGLILSGPNSGGKTIILKTLGLLSYLVSCSIPIPAQKNSRVDFFPTILADIGDVQSVQGDLSTFSGHLVTMREMFDETKYKLQHNTLVIMDEVGSGTDPNQGVALAQSILESLVQKGCKVAITTHFQSLKQLPSYDNRFTIAGMQFINNNQPTYKLLKNEIGESFALQIAQRYNIPKPILDRAYELLDNDTKTRLEYLQTLQSQKEDYEQRLLEIQQKQEQIETLQKQLESQKEQFEKDYNSLQSKKLQEFIESLQDKETKLSNILSNIQKDSNKKEVIAKSWEDIKVLKKDIITETLQKEEESENYDQKESITSYIPISDITPTPTLNVGDVVYIYKPNKSFHNKPAKIHTISSNGKAMEVFIDGAPIPIRMKTSELMLPKSTDHLPKIKEYKKVNKKLTSKIGKRALAELESQPLNMGKSDSILQDAKIGSSSSNVAMRTSSNTIDVRGKNASEAQLIIEDFFSKSIANRRYVVYILHGYGSGGVLRDKIRSWLNNRKKNLWIKSCKPADQSDGGDSFTCVELQS